MLTAVPMVIAVMFFALFTAFRRPDIGLIIAALLVLPIVVSAWTDQCLLESRVARYLRERSEYERCKTTPGRS
jgi:hypothetical protein